MAKKREITTVGGAMSAIERLRGLRVLHFCSLDAGENIRKEITEDFDETLTSLRNLFNSKFYSKRSLVFNEKSLEDNLKSCMLQKGYSEEKINLFFKICSGAIDDFSIEWQLEDELIEAMENLNQNRANLQNHNKVRTIYMFYRKQLGLESVSTADISKWLNVHSERGHESISDDYMAIIDKLNIIFTFSKENSLCGTVKKNTIDIKAKLIDQHCDNILLNIKGARSYLVAWKMNMDCNENYRGLVLNQFIKTRDNLRDLKLVIDQLNSYKADTEVIGILDTLKKRAYELGIPVEYLKSYFDCRKVLVDIDKEEKQEKKDKSKRMDQIESKYDVRRNIAIGSYYEKEIGKMEEKIKVLRDPDVKTCCKTLYIDEQLLLPGKLQYTRSNYQREQGISKMEKSFKLAFDISPSADNIFKGDIEGIFSLAEYAEEGTHKDQMEEYEMKNQ